MKSLSHAALPPLHYHCLIATSNHAERVDVCFRQGSYFDREILVLNTESDRRCLLQSYLSELSQNSGNQSILFARLSEDKVISQLAMRLAEQTGGYVAADIVALIRHAMKISPNKGVKIGSTLTAGEAVVDVLLGIFEEAKKSIAPSCLRGVSIQLPKISFDDIIGYHDIKHQLRRVIIMSNPSRNEHLVRLGLTKSLGGILLHGPPGNSKTRLAMAAAATHGLPMISLSSADIYSAYVGEAEAEIRKAFQVARQAAPCVLFLDELDSIVTNRKTGSEDGSSNGASAESRVLATLLTEMDGINAVHGDAAGGVIVIGATNRLDFIDAALLRKVRMNL